MKLLVIRSPRGVEVVEGKDVRGRNARDGLGTPVAAAGFAHRRSLCAEIDFTVPFYSMIPCEGDK